MTHLSVKQQPTGEKRDSCGKQTHPGPAAILNDFYVLFLFVFYLYCVGESTQIPPYVRGDHRTTWGSSFLPPRDSGMELRSSGSQEPPHSEPPRWPTYVTTHFCLSQKSVFIAVRHTVTPSQRAHKRSFQMIGTTVSGAGCWSCRQSARLSHCFHFYRSGS